MKGSIHRPEGFTLIELMVVILVIAILVAIAVPVYLNARANAQRRTCQGNLRTVDGAIMNYEAFFVNPLYPRVLADMTRGGTKVLKRIPRCPVRNVNYFYLSNRVPPMISCPNAARHTI